MIKIRDLRLFSAMFRFKNLIPSYSVIIDIKLIIKICDLRLFSGMTANEAISFIMVLRMQAVKNAITRSNLSS